MYCMYNPYMFPPGMTNPLDSKGMNPMYNYEYNMDPNKMPKDMNSPNMGMFYVMPFPMYNQNYTAQNFSQNIDKK